MTAEQVAVHLGGKKSGRGKWLAKCTAHNDTKPSLSITEGKTGVLLSCHSHQCRFLDIVHTAGLKPLMLRYDYDPNGKVDQRAYEEAKRRREAQEVRERIRKRKISKLIDEVRTWETAASLLHAQLMRDLFNKEIAVLWRRSLATARARNEELRELWPECPDVQTYHLWRMTPDVSERFIGTQIGEVLGCLGAVGYETLERNRDLAGLRATI